MLARVFQLVFIQNDVKHVLRGQGNRVISIGFSQKVESISDQAYGGALRELVGSHHLHVQVLALRLAPGLDQPLQHLEESAEVNAGPTPARRAFHSTFGEETLT